MTKPDGPLTKAGMRRAAKLMREHTLMLRGLLLERAQEPWMRVILEESDEILRLSRQLYAKAREPKS